MEWTGERWVPGKSPGGIEEQHVARYEWAKGFCEGKRVLDVGCGCGAGTAMLAEVAAEIEACDASDEAVAYAQEHYPVCTYRGFPAHVLDGAMGVRKYADDFDVAVCFEVLEHAEFVQDDVQQIAAVLRPGGLLLASTPNRAFHGRPQVPADPDGFHVREYNVGEFVALIGANGFRVAGWSGQWPPGWEVRPCSHRAPEFVLVGARKA